MGNEDGRCSCNPKNNWTAAWSSQSWNLTVYWDYSWYTMSCNFNKFGSSPGCHAGALLCASWERKASSKSKKIACPLCRSWPGLTLLRSGGATARGGAAASSENMGLSRAGCLPVIIFNAWDRAGDLFRALHGTVLDACTGYKEMLCPLKALSLYTFVLPFLGYVCGEYWEGQQHV